MERAHQRRDVGVLVLHCEPLAQPGAVGVLAAAAVAHPLCPPRPAPSFHGLRVATARQTLDPGVDFAFQPRDPSRTNLTSLGKPFLSLHAGHVLPAERDSRLQLRPREQPVIAGDFGHRHAPRKFSVEQRYTTTQRPKSKGIVRASGGPNYSFWRPMRAAVRAMWRQPRLPFNAISTRR